MTTSTSRSASAAPTASAWPGRKAGKPNSSCSAPCGIASRARRAPAGAGRGRAARGSRRLPWAAGHYPRPRRAPAVAGRWTAAAEPCERARVVADGRSTTTSRSSTRRMRERARRRPARRLRRRLLRARRLRAGPQRHRRHRGRRRRRSRPRPSRRSSTALRHEALPCPARGLELVVYPLATVAGRRRASPASSSTSTPARAWTSASTRRPATSRASGSRSTARSCASTAIALHGPPAAELFAPIPREAAAAAARGVGPLAPRLRRPARHRRRAQHRPRAALRRHRGRGSRSARPALRCLDSCARPRLDRGVSVRVACRPMSKRTARAKSKPQAADPAGAAPRSSRTPPRRAASRRRSRRTRRSRRGRGAQPRPRRSATRAARARASLTSGSACSNASFCCPEPVLSSGYSPEKQASQCVARSPSIAA